MDIINDLLDKLMTDIGQSSDIEIETIIENIEDKQIDQQVDESTDQQVAESTDQQVAESTDQQDIDEEVDIPDLILEFNNNRKKTNISAILMVKNESLKINVTLESILGFVDNIIIYDTGSKDNTIDIITEFCNKYKINLYLKHGTFKNFSISRNVLLDFADSISGLKYLLLLDCNDELRNGPDLIKFIATEYPYDGFFVQQKWNANIVIDYYNIRFIKAYSGHRYKGAVHEYIEIPVELLGQKIPKVVIYQDRNNDDNKSKIRFNKDKVLLLNEYNSSEKTPRTVYYLAQTYDCLSEKEKSYFYYKERIELDGYIEEKYHAAYNCGQILKGLGKSFSEYLGYYIIAFSIMHRCEPLVRLCEYYISQHSWSQAYYFINEACNLDYPNCGLFVDAECYRYYRWHLMGIVAYYVKEYKKGFDACTIAINCRQNPTDISNLSYYKNELTLINNDTLKISLL
jgi:hypothetical protein